MAWSGFNPALRNHMTSLDQYQSMNGLSIYLMRRYVLHQRFMFWFMGMCTTDTNTRTLTFYRLIKISRPMSVCACVLACVCVHIKRYPLWYLFDVKIRPPCIQRNSILLLHHQSIDFLIMYLASVWTWPLWLFLFTSLHKEDTPEATKKWAVKTWWEHQMETFFSVLLALCAGN